MSTEQELIEKIKYHRDLYWNNISEISDTEYDNLLKQLKDINSESKILQEIEHYQLSNNKIHHNTPMLSLEKVFDYESILNWALKHCRSKEELLTFTPKYDGISARLYKKDNILATRGDGDYGENISDKIPNVIFITKNPDALVHTGELLIPTPDFEKIKDKITRKDGKKYSNPRNFVGGFVNSKESLSDIKIYFVSHKYYALQLKLSDFTKERWNDVITDIQTCSEYPLDGIVIEISDEDYSESLGFTSHHPKGKIAFKFETEFKYSKINDIEFSCGKRKITPVAIIEPVEINNVTIKRVSLHNAKMLLDNDVHINDIVKVFRSGDVIPYIAEVKPSETYRKKIEINKCPSCGSKVIYKEPELICSNEHCDGSNAKLLFQAVQTLGIDNIGLTTIDKFIEYLDVKDITDILELNEEDLELLPGFGEKLIEKIYTNILTVRNSVIDDYKLLACLNIKGIGNTLSKAILEKCTLTDLLNNIESDKFIEIFGIGENRSDELINGISENYEILDYLMKTFDYTNTKDKDKKTSLGKICFTGKFDCHKSHYYDIAKSKGYEIVESVSKDLLYLVSNGAATSKTSKARKINIKILNLDQFLKL